MKSKYYTPEIEEFCIGFEYEVVYEDNSVDKYMFGEDLENADGFIPWITPDYFLKLLSENKIRAKYLDQEDIIECGWYKHHDTYFSFKNKDIKSHSNEYFLNDVLVLSDSYFLEITDSIITIQDFDYEVIFKGTIKNKSELKKLMQMLNIQTDAK